MSNTGSVWMMDHVVCTLFFLIFSLLAAHKVYEQGLRVASESQGVEALEIQENCFVTAISLLSLLSPKYQWIVKPEDRSIFIIDFVLLFNLIV